ncbi:cell envelope-related function transcriptional attenuator common domain-containing protein [Nonomuraea maritima]|uniref:Cell envelope-related function transcriptional attenuator common domain-containing protein n=1 Tax=Nonomuraea maritima TaxID=683260 RepID=A0A1G9NCA1_9ACTN|nr:LCP family protein [Nonomuraea maritima]SDL84044.1 cell envelope-related function transcriptional attenuator common domain-containing protein [Nonomuraea maritima]
MTGKERDFGLGASVVLTVASAVLWGVAHIAVERRKSGLALMAAYLLMLAGALTVFTAFSIDLLSLAVQPRWMIGFTVALIAVAVLWSAVIVWSFLLVRPPRSDTAGRVVATVLTVSLCALVVAPTAYAARLAYISRDVVTTLFTPGDSSAPILADDPWNGAQRVNFLLIGADSAPGRPGVRTDSMTVASVDVLSGDTVLFGLPRNLEQVPLPKGPAHDRFPWGFTGTGPTNPGLLNEIYQYGNDHPEVVPGVPKQRRGSELLKQTVSGILGIPVHFHAMVDMKGFAEIVDAMGGVRVTVHQPIVYGKYREGLLPAGTRRLSGAEALWYGRSRTDSDDYVRMGRQKCLLNAVAKQADPLTVLNSFERLAAVTKRFISTDLPQDLLPAVIDLSQRVRDARIRSLSFVPPLVNTAAPDWQFIRRSVRDALREHPRPHRAALAVRPQAAGAARDVVSLNATCR